MLASSIGLNLTTFPAHCRDHGVADEISQRFLQVNSLLLAEIGYTDQIWIYLLHVDLPCFRSYHQPTFQSRENLLRTQINHQIGEAAVVGMNLPRFREGHRGRNKNRGIRLRRRHELLVPCNFRKDNRKTPTRPFRQ